ncbi:SRPBCC family protein [Streptomyces himalayensis]|uniref:SRPBCC family protein n=1 Tax=Streptomyces himalayensis subsp. himalayensis TaxID=2756131 RepID=A0A7W0DVX0_9ACTN|nr:SRPBCC family protein [Streptomyces himalayensis]MBA2951718.1 SRPBCC family protein [Streptomyces himalayensis subsp. himalayensis]
MALIRIERLSPHSPAEAWRRLTDWKRHADVVPLTRVTVTTPPPTHEGTLFVARTCIGPAAFDDPMQVTVWQPPDADHPDRPARCRLDKRGTFVTGWAEIEVHRSGAGSRVVWLEELRVRWLPPFLDPSLAAAGRLLFGRAADDLLRRP